MDVVHGPCQEQGIEVPLSVARRMDLGRPPARASGQLLGLLPPLAPAADRCAWTAVLATIASKGGSPNAATVAYRFCHNPHWLHRLNSVVLGPYSSGSPRQRSPSRNVWRIPLATCRSSTRACHQDATVRALSKPIAYHSTKIYLP